MAEAELVAQGHETDQAYLAIGCETFEADGARFVRNTSMPDRFDANHVDNVTAATPGEIDALLHRVEVEFAGQQHRRFDLGPMAPPGLQARLLLEGGYQASDGLTLVLEGDIRASPKPADIRLVQDEEQWQGLFALNAIWLSSYPPETHAPVDQTNASNRMKSPAVRWWLAYVDGVPRAFLNSWEGRNGVGKVEDVFTHPDYRHRGLATSLLAHAVADARAHGAGPVVIGCDPNDTPRHMYASLGWRPLFVVRQLTKRLA